MILAILDAFIPLKLLLVADTHFASCICVSKKTYEKKFVFLKGCKLVKLGLQSMVVSEKWVA